MEKLFSNYLNQDITHYNIEGLNIQHIKKNSSKVYFGFNIFAGSKDNIFNLNNHKIKLPSGIAHLVEHIVFSLPQKNLVNDLVNQGIDINGATSYSGTNFYLGGNKQQIMDNNYYEVLFDIVTKLNYNQETLENELQIVLEEANLEYNSKDYKVEQCLATNLFEFGLKNTIVGTKKDLHKISWNDVKCFYNNFYCLDNCVLTLVGDLTTSELNELFKYIYKIITKAKEQLNCLFNNKIKCLKIEEKCCNLFELKKQKFTVSSNTINTNVTEYYIPINIYDNITIKELKIAIDLLLSLLSEDFNESYSNFLHENNLSSADFDFWYKNYNNEQIFLVIEIKNNLDEDKKIITKLLNIFKQKISETQFKFLLKSHQLSILERLDENLEDFANDYLAHILYYCSTYKNYNDINVDLTLENLTYKWLINIQNHIDIKSFLEINCITKE